MATQAGFTLLMSLWLSVGILHKLKVFSRVTCYQSSDRTTGDTYVVDFSGLALVWLEVLIFSGWEGTNAVQSQNN